MTDEELLLPGGGDGVDEMATAESHRYLFNSSRWGQCLNDQCFQPPAVVSSSTDSIIYREQKMTRSGTAKNLKDQIQIKEIVLR